jgi:hypothetical protein
VYHSVPLEPMSVQLLSVNLYNLVGVCKPFDLNENH